MNNRRTSTALLPPALGRTVVTLPDGRSLDAGTEIKVAGESGSFKFRFASDNGDLNCWGPVDSRHACWRAFRPSRVTRIHRKPVSRSARIEAES